MPEATAAADPLEDPPSECVTDSGLRVGPGWNPANSVVTVLPAITPPARRVSASTAASKGMLTPA